MEFQSLTQLMICGLASLIKVGATYAAEELRASEKVFLTLLMSV